MQVWPLSCIYSVKRESDREYVKCTLWASRCTFSTESMLCVEHNTHNNTMGLVGLNSLHRRWCEGLGRSAYREDKASSGCSVFHPPAVSPPIKGLAYLSSRSRHALMDVGCRLFLVHWSHTREHEDLAMLVFAVILNRPTTNGNKACMLSLAILLEAFIQGNRIVFNSHCHLLCCPTSGSDQTSQT